MIHTASAMTVRNNLGELLSEVQYRHDTILITKAGKPVAALIDVNLFERISRMRAKFDYLTTQLGKTYHDADMDQAEADIQEALKKIRGK